MSEKTNNIAAILELATHDSSLLHTMRAFCTLSELARNSGLHTR